MPSDKFHVTLIKKRTPMEFTNTLTNLAVYGDAGVILHINGLAFHVPVNVAINLLIQAQAQAIQQE